ncbi:MAG TPA: hypothetical protein VEU11_14820 [Terriglobales bacterium]|jgi:hypothetical protein|nr:hypothetical protein [Terriglobales bacterium]
MPLIRNIEDPRVVGQIDGLNRRSQFIREIASAILSGNAGFESVSSIANRVYERHCSPQAQRPDRVRFDGSRITALSA